MKTYRRNNRAKVGYTRLKGIKDKPVNITYIQYVEIMGDFTCFYCSCDTGLGVGLDRKDNRYGYSPKNVVPCCWNCNNLRSNLLTVDEMLATIETLKTIRGPNVWAQKEGKKNGIHRRKYKNGVSKANRSRSRRSN